MRRLDYCSSRGAREAPDWLGLRAERVVAETLELAERYGATELVFKDEDFFGDAERVEEIASGLVDGGAPFALARGGAPQDVLDAKPAALRRLHESGCRRLQLRAPRARPRELAAGGGVAPAGGRASAAASCSTWRRGRARRGPRRRRSSVARALCAMDSRFETPIRRAPRRRCARCRAGALARGVGGARAGSPGRTPRPSGVWRARAFFFAEAQRPPGPAARQAPAARARARCACGSASSRSTSSAWRSSCRRCCARGARACRAADEWA